MISRPQILMYWPMSPAAFPSRNLTWNGLLLTSESLKGSLPTSEIGRGVLIGIAMMVLGSCPSS